jgi:hypothetical protein
MRSTSIWILSLIILVLFFVSPARAQSSIRIGLVSGLNIANAYVSTSAFSTSTRTSLMIGAIVQTPIVEPFFVRGEMRYTPKGAIATFVQNNPAGPVVYKMDYIEIPLTLAIKPSSKGFLFVGPDLGFLIAAKAGNENMKQFTKFIDFAIDAGGGLIFALDKPTSVFADLRYSYGLLNIIRSTEHPDEVLRIWKSRDVKLSIGVLFSL